MKHVIILFLSVVFSSTILFAQTTGKISGTVTDANTGAPVIGANIIIEGSTIGAAADIEGYFVILNVSPGTYTLKASAIGYSASTLLNVRVNIDQTTNADFKLSEEVYETGEVVVVAKTPIVQKDVASSGVNLNSEEIQNLPVVSITSVVGLQAGVDNGDIRGSGSADEIVYQVNGITMRDGRDNTPYSNVSFTSVEQVKVQTGGFTADVGDVRSGLIQVVTKEGQTDKYTFSFYSQYSPYSKKHFGQSVNDPNSFFLRPYLDDAVAWTGTKSGAWNEFIQRQYPEFIGWNAVSQNTLQNDNPDDDLSPEAARRLFLWQYRKAFEIDKPDYDIDLSFGGPIPLVSKELGNLRFLASYKQNETMLLVPLSTDDYNDYDASLKLTSDLGVGKKLMIEGHFGQQAGTGTSTSGLPGLFKDDWNLADRVDYGNYTKDVLFSNAYFSPTTVKRNSLAAKFTNALSSSTYYEVVFSNFNSDYNTSPGTSRDYDKKYKFGNNYFVDEAPFGYDQGASNVINPSGMLLGTIYSQSRDSSYVSTYNLKFDLSSQLDKFHNIKTGIDFKYIVNDVNYGIVSETFSNATRKYTWNTKPIQAAVYAQDKLEFEEMVATIGVRVEYSDPNDSWYDYTTYDLGFTASNAENRDQLIPKKDLKPQVTVMPRLGMAFPISVNSKLFLNYGHYQTLPIPSNLYRIANAIDGKLEFISNPESKLEKTIQYELGYEQNILDQFLLRITGYYKDITNESRDITYISADAGVVTYDKPEPVSYRDIRGFEFELNKNRGEWITGFINYNYMASSDGKFGWGKYYESPTLQNIYIQSEGESWLIQNKYKPRPVARLNLSLFTPNEFGPEVMGTYPLEGWRMNILSTWKAGSYTSWTGGSGEITAKTRNNLQWVDNFNTDLRFSKDFNFGAVDLQLFVQINNLFNDKRLSSTGFSRTNFDYDRYIESLHLSSSTSGIEQFKYVNIPGEDKPGDYRDYNVDYTPIEAVRDLATITTPVNDLIYFDESSKGYFEYVNASWQPVDSQKIDKILKDKSYIDMPNYGFFTFLNPRDIYFGLKFNIAL
ncbi:MAG: carboxypeptidase-like regulatory domain-containing protein [Ignavibacteriales bacterium]|nr:carboxypeptidase-like regulatory domain-containing protein [Ignavibacteriales bacterium]